MKRKSFGVIARGVSGRTHYWCATRSTADRIRRTLRAWNGWTGARTLDALVMLANEMPGRRAVDIIEEFDGRRIVAEALDRLREKHAEENAAEGVQE